MKHGVRVAVRVCRRHGVRAGDRACMDAGIAVGLAVSMHTDDRVHAGRTTGGCGVCVPVRVRRHRRVCSGMTRHMHAGR